ncbi:hypothetical protein QE411_002890 [Microbacterium arborescens]|nr:hypothetical protein [Microbacterium arborescens]
MNGIYDRVTSVTRRRAQASTPGLERANGYAFRVGEGWFWFPAIEPAYVFARTTRMSPAGGGSIHIVEAAHEVCFDEKALWPARWHEQNEQKVDSARHRCKAVDLTGSKQCC